LSNGVQYRHDDASFVNLTLQAEFSSHVELILTFCVKSNIIHTKTVSFSLFHIKLVFESEQSKMEKWVIINSFRKR